MNYSLLESKSVAECKGFKISPQVLTNVNGYYYVVVQVGDAKEDTETVYLSKRLTETMKELGTTFIPKEAVFRMTVNADGEERFKLGSPPVVLVDMATIPSWG
jgi:hypothetical protein